jgi:hypothetical protein
MSLTISREWATPLTIGAFVLMACTGILMFFHLDTGLNKEAHEWLGWAMVAGVVAHSVANWTAFSRHLARPAAQVIIGVFVVILAASFFIKGEDEGGGGNPAFRASKAVLAAPLSTVATRASGGCLASVATLKQAGFKVGSAEQTLLSVTGPERDQQFKALALIFH